MIKVSVIIPFYNQSQEILEQSIFSALNQTISDIEIICIDDGSEDKRCLNFLNDLRSKDTRIKLFTIKHSGSAEARNLGIRNATGENIVFLDSDDYYPDNSVLENLYTIKKEFNVKIAGGKHLILNDGLLEEPYFNYGDINNFFCNKIVKYEDYQFPWWYWCFMFETSLIKENNIFFPPYLRYQDPPFFVRAMHKAQTFYAANFVSYIHRNSNNLQLLTEEKAEHHVQGIADILKYSDENDLDKLHNLLYKTFLNYDKNLLDNIQKLSEEKKLHLQKVIKQSTNFNKIN